MSHTVVRFICWLSGCSIERPVVECDLCFFSPGHIANPEGDGRVAWVLKSIASLNLSVLWRHDGEVRLLFCASR